MMKCIFLNNIKCDKSSKNKQKVVSNIIPKILALVAELPKVIIKFLALTFLFEIPTMDCFGTVEI